MRRTAEHAAKLDRRRCPFRHVDPKLSRNLGATVRISQRKILLRCFDSDVEAFTTYTAREARHSATRHALVPERRTASREFEPFEPERFTIGRQRSSRYTAGDLSGHDPPRAGDQCRQVRCGVGRGRSHRLVDRKRSIGERTGFERLRYAAYPQRTQLQHARPSRHLCPIKSSERGNPWPRLSIAPCWLWRTSG